MRLTTTTDNPDDAVQDLANFFGSLAVGNLAGVVDGGLKFAGTGVFNNLNTWVACQGGKCDANGELLDVPPSTNGGGGLFGGGGGGGNKSPSGLGALFSQVPHLPPDPYPGRKPGRKP